jgi:hypothetical protein
LISTRIFPQTTIGPDPPHPPSLTLIIIPATAAPALCNFLLTWTLSVISMSLSTLRPQKTVKSVSEFILPLPLPLLGPPPLPLLPLPGTQIPTLRPLLLQCPLHHPLPPFPPRLSHP